jgi:nucleotide-binding universal stress UspA family protein
MNRSTRLLVALGAIALLGVGSLSYLARQYEKKARLVAASPQEDASTRATRLVGGLLAAGAGLTPKEYASVRSAALAWSAGRPVGDIALEQPDDPEFVIDVLLQGVRRARGLHDHGVIHHQINRYHWIDDLRVEAVVGHEQCQGKPQGYLKEGAHHVDPEHVSSEPLVKKRANLIRQTVHRDQLDRQSGAAQTAAAKQRDLFGAHTYQRSVRTTDHLYTRTYHPGAFRAEWEQLFNVTDLIAMGTHGHRLRSEAYLGPTVAKTTSGSTGVSITVHVDPPASRARSFESSAPTYRPLLSAASCSYR